MKIAVSNIAWPTACDHAVAQLFGDLGIGGIEVAPAKIWSNPAEVPRREIDAYRSFWESRGIEIVAAQALLFGRPELTLFDDSETLRRTVDYLGGVIRTCSRLGAKVHVFGSPKNRRIGDKDRSIAWHEAVDCFRQLGEIAAVEGTCVAIEANPPIYGGDFITHTAEALELVRAVDHDGFRLHLDSACMTMAGDMPETVMPIAVGHLVHFHASEPNLETLENASVDHMRFARSLQLIGYKGWVSMEMREVAPFDVAGLGRAVRRVQSAYESGRQ